MSTRSRPQIILVDDDPFFLKRMLSLFSDEYECHTAPTGRDGIILHQRLMNQNPLVVCDVRLPDISGFEVCQQIKANNSKTRVLLLTMYNDSASRMNGLQAYADQYIDKLIAEEELKLLVRNTDITMRETALSEVGFSLPAELPAPSNTVTEFESNVRSIILSHYHNLQSHRTVWECSSKKVADKMNMAYRTFQREIKNVTGHSFKQLHLIVRLEKTKELLEQGYTVSQLADYLSFSNPAHLSRAFKEHFGLTPSKYKQCSLANSHHQKPSECGIVRT